MYTSPITAGSPQTVYTQSVSAAPEKSTENQEAAAAAKTVEKDQDIYTPSSEEKSADKYVMDADTVNRMKAELDQMKLRFLDTVKKSLGIQISYGQGAWRDLTPEDITPEVQAAAQEAISENGYWGVKQTSERIVAFGKALVGGDPSRVEEMRDAFIKGYDAATKAWGSALPDITRDTYDAVMKLFDEWAGISADEEEDSGEAEDGKVENGLVKQPEDDPAVKPEDDPAVQPEVSPASVEK